MHAGNIPVSMVVHDRVQAVSHLRLIPVEQGIEVLGGVLSLGRGICNIPVCKKGSPGSPQFGFQPGDKVLIVLQIKITLIRGRDVVFFKIGSFQLHPLGRPGDKRVHIVFFVDHDLGPVPGNESRQFPVRGIGQAGADPLANDIRVAAGVVACRIGRSRQNRVYRFHPFFKLHLVLGGIFGHLFQNIRNQVPDNGLLLQHTAGRGQDAASGKWDGRSGREGLGRRGKINGLERVIVFQIGRQVAIVVRVPGIIVFCLCERDGPIHQYRVPVVLRGLQGKVFRFGVYTDQAAQQLVIAQAAVLPVSRAGL